MKYICNEKGKENVIVKKSILFFYFIALDMFVLQLWGI